MQASDKLWKTKYNKYVYTLAVFIIVFVLLFNLVVASFVDMLDLKYDITAKGMYDLSEESINIINKTDIPISITVFCEKNGFNEELVQLFSRYEKESNGNITVSYVDPYLNISIVDEYTEKGLTIDENSVVVSSDLRCTAFKPIDFYTIDTEKAEITGFIAEQTITNALLYVTTEDMPVVLCTTGHGEGNSFSESLISTFKNNQLTMTDFYLLSEDIPEDASLLLIVGPSSDFLPQEIEKLDEYLFKGGRMIVFLDPSVQHLKNFEMFLSEWGIGISDYLVLESSSYVYASPLNIKATYTSHEINQELVTNEIYTITPNARALDMLFSVNGGIVVNNVLVSSQSSYGKPITEIISTTARMPGDEDGPFSLAIASTRNIQTFDGQVTAKLFVMDCLNFFADEIMQTDSFANARFIRDLISWNVEKPLYATNIPAKEYRIETLSVDNRQATLFGLLFQIIVPISVFVIGFITWIKRRNA